MKSSFLWMALLLSGTATLQQCTDDGEQARPGKTQTTGSAQVKDAGSGRLSAIQPVFTIKPAVLNYAMSLDGQFGIVYIDWGDGNTTTDTLTRTTGRLEHSYAAPGDYEIKVTGDLDKIDYFSSNYGDGEVSDVNVTGLPALANIEMVFINGPSVIDLSKNTQLLAVNMPRVAQLKQLILPPQTLLRYIDVGGPNQMTTADIDNVIDQVHAGAKANQTTNGFFFLNGLSHPGSGAVGPPSAAGWAKLSDLQDNYGWEIQPAP